LQLVRVIMRGPPYLAVVQRGNVSLYNFLREHFARQGLVHVIWDRRVASRRVTRQARRPDRRRGGSRRRSVPETWTALGFVLVRREDR
jgi:hypothetical protein